MGKKLYHWATLVSNGDKVIVRELPEPKTSDSKSYTGFALLEWVTDEQLRDKFKDAPFVQFRLKEADIVLGDPVDFQVKEDHRVINAGSELTNKPYDVPVAYVNTVTVFIDGVRHSAESIEAAGSGEL